MIIVRRNKVALPTDAYPVLLSLNRLPLQTRPDTFKSNMESSVREASHAGSWYTDHGPTLTSQLQGWLDDAQRDMADQGKVSRPGARVIIAP